MKFNIEDIFEYYKYSDEEKAYFSNFNVLEATYQKAKDTIIIKLENDNVLPFKNYKDLYDYFMALGVGDIKLYIKVKDDDLNLKELNHYFDEFKKRHGHFKDGLIVKTQGGFKVSYVDEDAYDTDSAFEDDLRLFFYDIGYRKNIDLELKGLKTEEEIIVPSLKPSAFSVEEAVKDNDKPKMNYYRKSKEYITLKIDDLVDNMTNVKFTGKIFKKEERKFKTGNLSQLLYVSDDNNAVIVKVTEGKRFNKEDLKKNDTDVWANFFGNYHFDNFANDYIFEPDAIEYIDDPHPLVDDAPIKRVELHAHTKLSEMDGVSSPKELVNAAYSMGHKAVAITDHLCVQGFHEAWVAYNKLPKDKDFKLLYGCELNMVYPNLNIVYNCKDGLLRDQEYVVFDLETTGLSQEYDYIIEFGAVLMHRGQIIERKDFFIKPPINLSSTVKKLTNISEKDLETAKSFKERKDEILDFIKDKVLVAHNAAFDFGFLNKELQRINEKPLTNTVIDTLDLSRSLFKTRRAFRLGNMARQYNVDYNEEVAHRADYDAEVLSLVFMRMLNDLRDKDVNTIEDLMNFQGEDAFVKNRAFHTTVLCKNQKGLKDLYKIVSSSNIDTLAVFGSTNTKDDDSEYIAEPRVFKETLEKHRQNLLIGSACFNGEVFEIASTKTKEELEKVIEFYDYIEIQPLENYRFLYEDRELFTKERLQDYLKDIIDIALKLGKIVVATGDVHYVRKEDKILREIYISAKAIGGLRHPLYLFDKAKRDKQIISDQHFFTTKEMLAAFAWLNDEQLINDMVINNPNMIADSIELVQPFVNELKPPRINDAIAVARKCNINEEPFVGVNEVINADEYLIRLVWYNAKKTFGEIIDEFIMNRIQKELDAIIGNGYGVIYYTCHLMVKRSNDDGYIVGSRGSVGSSLVATLAGITEVNPLPPYYLCPKCHHLEWIDNIASGYDAKDKSCPKCGTTMKGEGQNIPFETFMGFNGDKVPDIDLNFSGDYQPKAHLFTREIFGKDNVFRAGTVSTVAEKTAFGYVNNYFEEKGITNVSKALKEKLVQGCKDVKRTTGQHAGGIAVLPDDMEIEDVTPIQYPANDKEATWYSTHFEYHDYNDILLKFDILGHVDPTAMRLFEKISGIDVKKIPMNDEKVLSLFYSSKALDIVNPNYHEETGAAGLPEFGTLNTRRTIQETRPKCFSELVQISGLSHGTDVWQGNAQELIRQGIKLSDVIGCRDDIMGTLMSYGLEPLKSFNIMEKVRKGKGLTADEEKEMLGHNVPKWYIDSCNKIKYMFPKAHAVAYCIMAVRVAWFKVYYPIYYYISYLTLRCDAYEIKTMLMDADGIYARMQDILSRMNSRDPKVKATDKEKDIYNTIEVVYEMVSRGYRLTNIDLYRSLASEFIVNPDNDHEIIPPFIVIDGLGANVGESIVKARSERPFLSKEELAKRTLLSTTLIKKLDELGVLKDLDEKDQISLF